MREHLASLLADVRRVSESGARGPGIVHTVVFPELCLPPEMLEAELESWFDVLPGLASIRAGSFHVCAERDRMVYNRLFVHDRSGVRFTHDKRGEFRVTRDQATAFGTNFRVGADCECQTFLENLIKGRELLVLESDLGKIAHVICADLLDPRGMVDALYQIRPDLVFVSAMSEDTEPFHDIATSLFVRGVGTLFVNASQVVAASKEADYAFVRLPLPTVDEVPPPNFRWTRDQRLLAPAHRGRQRLSDAWIPLPEASPAIITPNGAMMVDLSAWFPKSG